MCCVLFALAFNLLRGHRGRLSFGHAAYFGMASYACAYTAKKRGLTAGPAFLLGSDGATMPGAMFGALGERRRLAPRRHPICPDVDLPCLSAA